MQEFNDAIFAILQWSLKRIDDLMYDTNINDFLVLVNLITTFKNRWYNVSYKYSLCLTSFC